MSDALDEGLVQRIDARGTIEWSETCYRYTGAHRDALSGEGARRFGGRWNPPLLFPAIYLADSAQACMVEVERAAQAASTTAEKMLEAAYRLHTIDVTDLAVLDLTTPQERRHLWRRLVRVPGGRTCGLVLAHARCPRAGGGRCRPRCHRV